MSDSETDFFLSDSEETIIVLKKQISKMQKSFCHQQNDIKKLSNKNYEMNEILYENQKKFDLSMKNYPLKIQTFCVKTKIWRKN